MDWKMIGAVAIVALILGIGVYFLTRQSASTSSASAGASGGSGGSDSDLGARLGGALGAAAGGLIQLGVDEANRGSQKNIAET